MGKRMLVTGAAGYIGSHTCLELLAAGHEVVAMDNLANSSEESLRRVQEVTGKKLAFHKLDLLDEAGLDRLFSAAKIDAVIHFAGLKAVGESVEQPLRYYSNNVEGSRSLLSAMRKAGCRSLVFSSSCTIYGQPEVIPVTEQAPFQPASPYGRTKLIVEQMCRDVAASEPGWHIVLLRYFNPIGAHESGRIGEDPAGIPNNLLPFALQVASGQREKVRVYGKDYPTPDGTGVRDYIHVVDLALGHLKAVDRLPKIDGCLAVNLGTGNGYSVLEVVKTLSEVVGKPVPYELAPRRPGDIARVWADASLAKKEFGWTARFDLKRMCEDAWRWQSRNPKGYRA